MSIRLKNSCQTWFFYFSFHFFYQNCKIFEDQDLIKTQNQTQTKNIRKTNKHTSLLIRYLGVLMYQSIRQSQEVKKNKKSSQKRSHKKLTIQQQQEIWLRGSYKYPEKGQWSKKRKVTRACLLYNLQKST